MRNSLLFRLLGYFVLVIAIGTMVISWLTFRAIRNDFNLYTTRSSQVLAQQLAPALAEYYVSNGSWQGVEALLQPEDMTGMQGMMQSQGHSFARRIGRGMMAFMEQRIILTDAHGNVIMDSDNQVTGQILPSSQLQAGAPITANGNQLGTLVILPGSAQANSLAGQFYLSVIRSILIAVVIAGAIALLLGSVLFVQITAPIQKLRRAAQLIAAGDLSQRVMIHSKDELGELGDSFNHMAENLARAETLRRNLVADVAHELRTPLTVMQANLEGIQDGILPLDMEQVEQLHAQTLLLNRLVADLRLLSLAEAGQLKLEMQPTDLGRLVRKVGEQFAAQAQQQGSELVVETTDNLPLVQSDSDRVRQILSNLIDNALRYTPFEGKITIRTSVVESGVRVSVIDTGSGISAEDLPHVFDRFYRADKSRARASGGSGLGLAIVRQLVQAQGGQVGAYSPIYQKEGQGYGTEIWFSLGEAE